MHWSDQVLNWFYDVTLRKIANFEVVRIKKIVEWFKVYRVIKQVVSETSHHWSLYSNTTTGKLTVYSQDGIYLLTYNRLFANINAYIYGMKIVCLKG